MSERNIKLERLLFSCPEIDCQDLDTYPLVSDEDRHYMETDFFADTSCVHLYPYVRKNAAGTPFIDVYVWDQMLYPEMCRRFIICEGYRLPEEAEESLLAYLDHPFSSFGSGYEDEEEEEEEDFLETTNTFWDFDLDDSLAVIESALWPLSNRCWKFHILKDRTTLEHLNTNRIDRRRNVD